MTENPATTAAHRFGWRVVMRLGTTRLLRIGALSFIALIAIYSAVQYRHLVSPTAIGTDASNYYAAGLRLNDGHSLYSLGPGDRPVPIVPPYWAVPLLAPPPIAVMWRPLALLPGDLAMWCWWVASLLLSAVTVVWLVRTGSATRLGGLIILSPALALTVIAGNASAFLLPVLVSSARTLNSAQPIRRRAGMLAGVGIAVATAVKVTPIFLVAWLLIQQRNAALRGFLLGAVVIAGISIAGAGLEAHVRYLQIAADTLSVGATPLSLAGIASASGLPVGASRLLVPMIAMLGLAGLFLLRRHPKTSFSLAATLMVITSPVMYFQTLGLLAVALVPLAAAPVDSGPPTSRGP